MSSFPKAVVFDLDKTLAESKSAMTPEMGARLARLAERAPVAIISGARFSQFEEQAIPFVPESVYPRLFILPTSGAALYRFENGVWHALYDEKLSEEEAARIKAVLEEAAVRTGTLTGNEPSWGERVEYRGSQVTFSALGQSAPLPEKEKWDPNKSKRMKFRAALLPLLPEYEIALGGSTSVDVVRKGINKAYGVTKLAELLNVPIAEMLYVGDDLQEGGNDFIVKTTPIQTHAVRNPAETAGLIDSLLAN